MAERIQATKDTGTSSERPAGAPTFVHRSAVLLGFDDLFTYFQASEIIVENLIKCASLIKNAVILLSGTYGTGKNQLVNLVRHTFFGVASRDEAGRVYDAWKVSCSQDLTPHDILYHLDLGKLQRGEECVTPRPIITARLKYINEIQRATPLVHNALLSLLSEHEVAYRDEVFRSPDFICFLDRNLEDAGSSQIPGAFLDRIDYSIEIPAVSFGGAVALQTRKLSTGRASWDDLSAHVPPRLTAEQMVEAWEDVLRVGIPERVLTLANMVGFSFRVCVVVDRSITHPDFRLDCSRCEFKAEICSHIESPPPAYRFIESGLKVAQARAWLNGHATVEPEDFYFALPFVLGHRLRLRPELTGHYANSQRWIIEDAWQTIKRKIPTWHRALDAWDRRDRESLKTLHVLGENDLVVREVEKLVERER